MRLFSWLQHKWFVCIALTILSSCRGAAQDHASQVEQTCGATHLWQCATDVLHDQAGIWTSPFRLRAGDTAWLLPFAAASGLAIAYDSEALQQLGTDKNRIDTSHNIARFGSPEVTAGAGVGMYAIGLLTHRDKLNETGRLSAEAVLDASIVAQGLKFATNRDRPNEGERTGEFWPSGTKDYSLSGSFPSGHAAASWAFARVIAEEYRGILPRVAAYGFATAISISRVTGRDHFPSDALVGSGLGFLVGGYVYHHHSSLQPRRSGLVLHPVMDARMHTYGAGLEVTPSEFSSWMGHLHVTTHDVGSGGESHSATPIE